MTWTMILVGLLLASYKLHSLAGVFVVISAIACVLAFVIITATCGMSARECDQLAYKRWIVFPKWSGAIALFSFFAFVLTPSKEEAYVATGFVLGKAGLEEIAKSDFGRMVSEYLQLQTDKLSKERQKLKKK